MVTKGTAWRLAFAVLLVMPRAGATQAPPTSTIDTISIRRAVSAWMQRHRAPALSIAIALDGQPAWSAGFGLADPENGVAATSRTSYRLASVTKSITATAVMMRSEEHTSELQSQSNLVCRLLLEKKKTTQHIQ